MKLTIEQLKQMGVRADRAVRFVEAINDTLRRYDIDTALRVQHWLAQVLHESGRLFYVEEIASGAAYEGRRDLGNTQPGDGARYHGRGYIQLTGRANYRSYGDRLGVALERRPGLALRPAVGARVLARYFKERGIDDHARRGQWRDVRLEVNGGLNGWTTYERTVSSLLRASQG